MGVGHRRRLLLIFISLVAITAVVAGDSAYAISGTPSIETPTRNVTFEGQQYTIDAVTRITAEDSVTVTTTVPDGASYDLNLRGPDNQLIMSERLTGDAEYTFSYFGSGDAGTYAATIQDDGDTVAVYPIVISGYDVTVTTPDSVEAGAEATITATVSERDVERHSSLDSVQVVVGNDAVVAQQTMAQTTGDEYETTISTAGLEPQAYNVYVVVRGDETVRERAEILGVSDTVSMTVTADSTATPTTAAESGGGATPEPTTNPPSTETTPTTSTAVGTSTVERPEETSSTASPSTPSTESETTRPSSDGTPQPTATSPEGVIDPSTPQSRTTTGGNGPGFTLLVTVAVLLAVGLWQRKRA